MTDYKPPIDHRHTEKIVCPYCGEIYNNSHEYDNFCKMECCICDNEFELILHMPVFYSTEKIEDEK
jgi:hypothetical protein